jgi:glycosyltransferase involved in cell wall biosynthesis
MHSVNNSFPRVTLVHDWLNQYGGAERVLEHLVRMYPSAPLYTSIYWREKMPDSYRQWDIRSLWMDRLPGIYQHHQIYFPLYAFAFANLDLSQIGCDIVLSNKSGFCHTVKTGSIPHLCYCLSPTRYIWLFEQYAARENLNPFQKTLLKPLVRLLKKYDYEASQNKNLRFIAISKEIQNRIKKYYNRSSTIIYPPVNLDRFKPADQHEDYYLIVSRLIPYKRVDLAVKVFTELGLPLRIVGDGRDRPILEEMAGPSVSFLGRVSDTRLVDLLSHCKAFIFPGYEDFGLAPLEAQASGRPVIAFKAGGALDTVIDGETGVFFEEATRQSLKETLLSFNADEVNPEVCRKNAERFSVKRFSRALHKTVQNFIDGI